MWDISTDWPNNLTVSVDFISVLSVFFSSSLVPCQWGVISELDKLSALVQLSCKRNPLMDLDKNRETTRQLFIARISQLEILNRSQVCMCMC